MNSYLVLSRREDTVEWEIVEAFRWPGEAQHKAAELALANPLDAYYTATVTEGYGTESPVLRKWKVDGQ